VLKAASWPEAAELGYGCQVGIEPEVYVLRETADGRLRAVGGAEGHA